MLETDNKRLTFLLYLKDTLSKVQETEKLINPVHVGQSSVGVTKGQPKGKIVPHQIASFLSNYWQ